MTTYTDKASSVSPGALRAVALGALLGLPALAACADAGVIELAEASVTNATRASFGAPVPIGNGTGRTYVVMQADRMVEVGVALTEGAMEDLPAGERHLGPDHPPVAPFLLEMPAGNVTPFRFVGLDWNPNGHEPPGVYDTPHFDIHFYTISRAERDGIVPTDPDWATKAAAYPERAYIPEGYLDLATLGGVDPGAASLPFMGMHWFDGSTPELHGKAFTETFIYGSWNGKMIFVEPMITREFFLRKQDVTRKLPTAAKGVSPGSYRIYWDEASREYRVALSGFGGTR